MKPLTLDNPGKERAGIPLHATMFAYAFPLQGHHSLSFAPETPEEEAMLYGAFAYFQNADSLVALKAVTIAADGLPFRGPHMLTAHPGSAVAEGEDGAAGEGAAREREVVDGAKLREFLLRSGRCHPVTIKALRTIGVEKFWWLGPGEQIAEEGGGAWPHGAFIYIYGEDARENDCFLAVEGPEGSEAGLAVVREG